MPNRLTSDHLLRIFFATLFSIFLIIGCSGLRRQLAVAALMLATIAIVPTARQMMGFASGPSANGAVVRMGTYQFLVEGHVIWETVFVKNAPATRPGERGPWRGCATPRDDILPIAE